VVTVHCIYAKDRNVTKSVAFMMLYVPEFNFLHVVPPVDVAAYWQSAPGGYKEILNRKQKCRLTLNGIK
jgi:hypothetical protein